MKKFLAVMCALIMLALYILPAYAVDVQDIYPYISEIEVQPGNPRADRPEYEFSMLDNVVIRYDANSVTSAAVTPLPSDYPYDKTYEDFFEEVKSYEKLFDLNEHTVAAVYEEFTTALSYTFTAMGFTDTQEDMRIFLEENGIRLPANETIGDKAKVAVTYSAVKYDAVYALYEKETVFPTGISLDEALVVILSALTDTMLPSGIDTLTGLGLLVTENYVTGYDQLPVSDNPDASEIFHWVKVITAAQNNYQVPLESYDRTTAAQREYVDYAYHASILNAVYEISIDPIKLVTALQGEQDDALQKFILGTMLGGSNIAYDENATSRQLFDIACENGFFNLEQDFYTDVFCYELRVPADSEKVWFTPFGLAGQLQGSDEKNVTVFLNGVEMSEGATLSTPLDITKAEETVELRVLYDDKNGEQSETVYTYKVIKDASLNAEGTGFEDGDIVSGVQQFVDTIVPGENATANQIVDGIFNAVDSAVSQITPEFTTDELTTYSMTESPVEELLEGYDISSQVTDVTVEESTSETKRFDSDYLGELIGDVYATDADGNIITTQAIYSAEAEEEEQDTVIDKVAETVKESPEVVAVPSSLIAAFSVAGYLMNRKHRDADAYRQEEEKE